MGTRSMIGYTDPKTGRVHSIYCHWDGYPSHNGRILLNHYKDMKKIKRLVALGSLSSLGEHVSWRTVPKPWANRYHWEGSTRPQFVEKHTMETPVRGVTVAHWRDRGPEGGEKWENCKPEVGISFQGGQEFDYWYHDAKWLYRHSSLTHGSWVELTEAACNVEGW